MRDVKSVSSSRRWRLLAQFLVWGVAFACASYFGIGDAAAKATMRPSGRIESETSLRVRVVSRPVFAASLAIDQIWLNVGEAKILPSSRELGEFFTFSGVPAGAVELEVASQDFAPYKQQILVNTVPELVIVQLTGAFRVSVSSFEPVSGIPLAIREASLHLTDAPWLEGAAERGVVGMATSYTLDCSGSELILRLPRGRYVLESRTDGFPRSFRSIVLDANSVGGGEIKSAVALGGCVVVRVGSLAKEDAGSLLLLSETDAQHTKASEHRSADGRKFGWNGVRELLDVNEAGPYYMSPVEPGRYVLRFIRKTDRTVRAESAPFEVQSGQVSIVGIM